MHNDGTPFEFWPVSPFNMKRRVFPFLVGMLQCGLSRSHAKKKGARDDGKEKKKTTQDFFQHGFQETKKSKYVPQKLPIAKMDIISCSDQFKMKAENGQMATSRRSVQWCLHSLWIDRKSERNAGNAKVPEFSG
jgi:hypothetical protein